MATAIQSITELPLPQLRPVAKKAGERGCGKVRPSKTSRWRAASLIAVHLAVAGHVAHWYLTGRTLTPVEPSEAMQTLGREALLNAGCVFFAAAIVSTLIFGRFFCGWGCHIVALQDLCTWMLRRLGMAPKPFRSRLLMFMPLAAAAYMFVLPTVVRLWTGGERAALQPHFTTEKFWATFPDWPIALLTFGVCGFLIVYLLGNKGFCTYGCPYGGIFGLADKIAPGKIRVTPACDGCAHCTAVCTSNVRVHEEVRDFGMVVNPGCMKCMDCISVCPKEALYFGFGRPTVASRKAPALAARQARRYDYTWPEEALLLLIFVVSAAIFRALYDAVPLLLALGLAAISAYILMTAMRLVYQPSVTLGRFRLRVDQRLTRAGVVFGVVSALWALFLVHSGLVQYLALEGMLRLERAQARQRALGMATPEVAAMARAAYDSLDRCRGIGLTTPSNLVVKLGAASLLLGDRTSAEQYYREAVQRAPEFAAARFELARLAMDRKDRDTAMGHLRAIVGEEPKFPRAHGLLVNLLMEGGRTSEALEMLDELIRQYPEHPDFQLTRGLVLAHSGELEQALAVTREAVERWPTDTDAHFNLASMLANRGELEASLGEFERVVEMNPESGAGHFMCAKVALRLSRPEVVLSHLDQARRLEPYNVEYVAVWAMALKQADRLASAVAEAERQAPLDRAARFRLVHLYRAAGHTEDADKLAGEFAGLLDSQPRP